LRLLSLCWAQRNQLSWVSGGKYRFAVDYRGVRIKKWRRVVGSKGSTFLDFRAGITDFAELEALIAAAPNPHTLDFGNQRTLILNVTFSSLQSNDFILHH